MHVKNSMHLFLYEINKDCSYIIGSDRLQRMYGIMDISKEHISREERSDSTLYAEYCIYTVSTARYIPVRYNPVLMVSILLRIQMCQ